MKLHFLMKILCLLSSVPVTGILMICGNSGGNDSLSENIADSVLGGCVIIPSTEFKK
jgi:hypothetical protein